MKTSSTEEKHGILYIKVCRVRYQSISNAEVGTRFFTHFLLACLHFDQPDELSDVPGVPNDLVGISTDTATFLVEKLQLISKRVDGGLGHTLRIRNFGEKNP